MLRNALQALWAEPRPGRPPVRLRRDWALLGVLLAWSVLEALFREDLVWRPVAAPQRNSEYVGTVLSIMGLAVLAAAALPHIATAPLSDLYHAPGATLQDQTTLVLLWHGIEAMFDALLFTGLVILPLGLIALGTAMPDAPGYGTRISRATVALGVTGLAAATAVVVGVPAMGAVGVFALIGFHLSAGWKTHRLTRAPHHRMVTGA